MGKLLKLTSRSYLREHPFQDPISQTTPAGIAAPAQNHSYIFPGDELFLYHFLNLPADHPTAPSINDISLKSAKVSLIAKHPNVFDEQFSEQFQSSRTFILDSFITQFNNVNAPLIPWTSDGYAPFLRTEQDRNWRLPSGDLRREVKFQTTHTPSTNQWKLWFFYPVIFRWEYWLAKNGVNNFFFNTSDPNNGQNEWWYHYYKTVGAGDWRLYSRIEVTAVVQGEQTVFRSDLLLTPDGTGGDVNDYNSNTDWINKSIKTAVILGTPSNTPCLIKNNQPTEVFAYFSKNSAWSTDEQTKLSAVISIEPFEGQGLTARTRASSVYPVGSESVFMGLNLSITDDSGIGIQDSNGNYIVTDISGNGAILYFDALHPEKVMVYALIDHNKLNSIYPGVTKFTLYARLYNSFVDADKTRKGECIKQDALLVTAPISNDLCVRNEPTCPFNLEVFAEKVETDELKNDKSAFLEFGDALTSSVAFTLQKNDNANCGTGSWVDKATFSSNTYGQFFAFGKSHDFLGADYTDDYGKKYTGLLLKWSTILNAFGVGYYRMKIVKTDVFSNTTTFYDQRLFCLKEYNCNLVNRTVRIETTIEGLRGSLNNPDVYIDYAGGWYEQYRLRGVMKYKASSYTKEYNQYGESSYNAMKPVINEQTPKYTLCLRPIPGWMDWTVSTNILQADTILITDYNTANRHPFIKTPVINDGDFTPRDSNLANPLADVEVNLSYGRNNLRKRNSL